MWFLIMSKYFKLNFLNALHHVYVQNFDPKTRSKYTLEFKFEYILGTPCNAC